MSNRKARRAAASNKETLSSVEDIPLSRPAYSPPPSKTLYDIAKERQAELSKGQPFQPFSNTESEPKLVTAVINPDGTLSQSNGYVAGDDEPIGRFGQAVFFASTLTMLHFTLDVLVHQQYRIEIGWDVIAWSTARALLILMVLVYAFHHRSSAFWAQIMFMLGSIVTGCFLIHSSNREPYFAVMKRAPPLGTIWVWGVLEMRLELALLTLSLIGVFFWYGGYSMF